MAGTFELFTDLNEKFRFRLTSPDGRIVALSAGYDHKLTAVQGIREVRENAAAGLIVDLTETA